MNELCDSQIQQSVDCYLDKILHDLSPEQILCEFKNIFVRAIPTQTSILCQALHHLVQENRASLFYSILKRAYYRLCDCWLAQGQPEFVKELLKLFDNAAIPSQTFSPIAKRMKTWIVGFINSSDYHDLKIIATYADDRLSIVDSAHWSDRYLAYKLAARAIDPKTLPPDRHLYTNLSQHIKDRFKFDLAMYTTHVQSPGYNSQLYPNPSIFQHELLSLVKLLLARSGEFSYPKLAKRFLELTQHQPYQFFKTSLPKYIELNWQKKSELAAAIEKKFERDLVNLYADKDRDPLDEALRLRTCNRLIRWLTTETGAVPSPIFKAAIASNNQMSLAISLLQLILISPNSIANLELCLAYLLQYYEPFPESNFPSAVQFFEIVRIALAMYASNVEYSLVKIKQVSPQTGAIDLDHYRVFLYQFS
jgi:hypothetical protein